jgi:hypothetical protein
MESLDNATKSSSGFFKYVFNFDDDSKGDMLNIIQYAVLAIIPIVAINKFMQGYVPEADDEKGNLELSMEVILQTIVMFIGIFFVNRIITYIPTYSGVKYPDFSVIYIILAVLMITLSLQTKLGEKVSILSDRLVELWNGKQDTKKQNAQTGNVRVSQPISQGAGGMPPQMQSPNQAAINQAMSDNYSTSISMLPSDPQIPDYSNMYKQTTTPLVNANTPGMNEPFSGGGPMAANEALGGGMFGGAF